MKKHYYVIILISFILSISPKILTSQCLCVEDDCGDIIADFSLNTEEAKACDGLEFTITNDSNEADRYIWDWGDGTVDTTYSLTEEPSHAYDIPEDEICDDDKTPYNICLIIETDCGGVSCHYASTGISIIHRPLAIFDDLSQICVNTDLFVASMFCNGVDYSWTLGNGGTDTGMTTVLNYDTAGNYEVCLTVENECGMDTDCQTIQVVDNPIASITTTGNYEDEENLIACDDFTAEFSDAESYGNTQWQITALPPLINDTTSWCFTDTTTMTLNSGEIGVLFKQPGQYVFTLIADNACGEHIQIDTITIIDEPNVSLDPILNTCVLPFIFTPTAILSNDVETVLWEFPGGSSATSTDINPGEITYTQAGEYTVTVTVTNDCGTDTSTETFTILESNDSLPSEEFCKDQLPIYLDSIAEGTWSGAGINNDIFNTADLEGTYNLEVYTICETTVPLTLIVHPTPILTGEDVIEICGASSSINLPTINPTGGYWTGIGIIDSITGIFDPTIVSGSTTVIYNYTNPMTECSNTHLLTVNIFDVNITTTQTAYCDIDSDIPITATPPDGGIWQGNYITPDGIFSPSNVPTVGGIGYDTLIYALDDCIDTLIVSVTATGMVEAGSTDTLCQNAEPINLLELPDIVPTTGGNWSGTGVIDDVFYPENATVGENILTYTIGVVGICDITDTKIIFIQEVEAVEAGDNQCVCLNEVPITLAGFSPSGGLWSGEGITNANTGEFTPTTTGDFELTYTYTNQNTNCESKDTKIVTVEGIPPFAFSIDSVACVGDTLQLSIEDDETSGTTYTWCFENGDISTDPNPDYVFDTEGTQTVTLKIETVCGCIDEVTQEINIIGSPIALFSDNINNTTFICTPLLVDFTNDSEGQFLNYLWDFGNGDTSTLENPSIEYNEEVISDTTFYVTLTVWNDCDTTIYMDSVRASPTPQINYGINVDEICSGTPIVFNNLTIGNPETSYWDLGNGNTSTDFEPEPQTYYADTQDSIYLITLIAGNDCGFDTLSWEITVKPNTVEAFFFADDTTGCEPLTVNLQDYSTEGINIVWDFGNGDNDNLPNTTYDYTEAGTYIITEIVNNGCAYDTAYQDIIVHPAPTIDSLIVPTIICINDTATFSVASNDNISNYTWSFGDGDTAYFQETTHIFDSIGIFNVEVTVASTNFDCTATTSTTIEVIDNPVASFTYAQDNVCSPSSIEFTTTSNTNCLWDFGDGNTATDCEPTHEFTSTIDTFFVVTFTSINEAGCREDTTQNIFVKAQPISDFAIDTQSFCDIPATVQLTNLSSDNAAGFLWDFENGDTSTLNNPSATFTDYGEYTISLTVNTAFGCTDTYTQTIQVFPQPQANFIPNLSEGCEPTNITFENNTTNATNYYWDFGDGNTSIEETGSNEYENAGIYSAQLIATYDTICYDTLILENAINIYESPTANFTIDTTKVCEGGEIQFTNLSIDASTVEWDFGNGDNATTENSIYSYNTDGVYSISLIATHTDGCKDTLIFNDTITILPIPNISIENSNINVCEDIEIEFTNSSNDATNYIWNFGNGDTSTEENPNYSYDNEGIYTVTIEANYENTCFNSETFENLVEVKPTPIANFSYENIEIEDAEGISQPTGVIDFFNLSEGASAYLWTFGDGDSSDLESPSHQYNISGEITTTLTAFNDLGCWTQIDSTIIINDFGRLFIPNALTPEWGPELTRVFKPIGFGLSEFDIKIYSKWGDIVWESNELIDGKPIGEWNGTFKDTDEALPQGAYVWEARAVFLDGSIWKGKEYKNGYKTIGTVTIIR